MDVVLSSDLGWCSAAISQVLSAAQLQVSTPLTTQHGRHFLRSFHMIFTIFVNFLFITFLNPPEIEDEEEEICRQWRKLSQASKILNSD